MGLIKRAFAYYRCLEAGRITTMGHGQYKYQKLNDDNASTRETMFVIVTISAVTYGLHCLLCHGK